MSNKKFAKIKRTALAALCALSVTCTGLAAACAPSENNENNNNSSTQREDTQLLKNGNFEFSTVPEDAVHLIKNVNSWSRAGDSTGTMSGIIDTSKSAWEKLTDAELKDKLDANEDLSKDDPDYDDLYVDYNGMDSDDLLYADSYAASLDKPSDSDDIISRWFKTYQEFMGVEGDTDSYTYNGVQVYRNPDDSEDVEFYYDRECTQPIRYTMIENPQTHLGEYREANGKHYLGDTEVFLDEDGNFFLDEDMEEPVGNVLMLHNYPTNKKYNGIEQHYTSQTITLEANTAAEISLWVKTSNLKFDKGHALTSDEENRGAYIEVTQTVASNTVDSFKIRAINTEKIIADNADGSALGENESNGWLKYTIYVNACDFASSTISLNLGLGDSDNSLKVTGYAFFDDVEVKKFIDLSDEGSTYSEHADEISDRSNPVPKPSYCSLTSEADDKVFIADRQVRGGDDVRFSNRFHYLVDLASDNYTNVESMKEAINFFDNANLKASLALTTEESGEKIYASATNNQANVVGFDQKDDAETYLLPEGLKAQGGRPTFNDLIGIYNYEKSQNGFTEADFTGKDGNEQFRDLSERLNSALSGENGLSALSKFSLNNSGSMVVMLSAYGAAYTATFENQTSVDPSLKLFTVDGYKNTDSTNYKIISFWVKTSDMNGKTAATIKLIDAEDDDNVATLTVDTTDVVTDVGEQKNIYNDWVQCFFFVHNDTDVAKDFKLEFSFGNTTVMGTTDTGYDAGWVALANMQSINVTEQVFDLVSEGTYSKTLTFGEEDKGENHEFDAANGMSNVKAGVANPSTYNGVNGGSSYVTDKIFNDDYDQPNNVAGGVAENNGIAGLINRDSFAEYDNALDIARAFNPSVVDAQTAWNEVFGEDCYQPLIIVNSLREYLDRASEIKDEADFIANKDSLYVKDEDGNYVAAESWDETATYYWYRQVVNYGFIGDTQNIASDSYTTVSVKVMVSAGATAYVYLVDPANRKVMNFETPDYTFYYDVEGNVLDKEYDEDWSDAERREAIVYSYRTEDGLYEDADGVLYANLYNLTSRYKYAEFEDDTFYLKNEDGTSTPVGYDNLKDGETYYSDAACTKVADHYLCVDSQRVYAYDSQADAYYYMVNGERGAEVKNFDVKYARYTAEMNAAPEYSVKIEDTKGEWVTVNFVIHTGNQSKDYRLELWSGERGQAGQPGSVAGAVAFDYSSYSITSSNYSTVLTQYEGAVVEAYEKLILSKDANNAEKLEDGMNIYELENLMKELGITDAEKEAALTAAGIDKDFVARYYTFTLYDSAQYVPFNRTTAEDGQTGYEYTITDNSETLVYFRNYDESNKSYNLFVDYSAVDQTVSIGNADNNDDDETEENTNNNGDGWLLIVSIIFAVVMIFTLLAMLFRYLWKKFSVKRKRKGMQKNNYKQRDRYMRKLGLVKTTPVEEEPTDEPEVPAEEPEETANEEPEEVAAEEPAETAEEQTQEPETEAPAENDGKDE